MSDTADLKLFKQMTPENWLNSDDTRSGIAVFTADGSTFRITDQDWAERFLEEDLSVAVPLEIRNLFEVARGTLCYGCFFYPLYTLGCQELFRVMDAATMRRCKELHAPQKVSTFAKRLVWLREKGQISAEEEGRWHATRKLRNMSSHQERQSLYDPGDALGILRTASSLINALFDEQRR